jgi:hypothetical protein
MSRVAAAAALVELRACAAAGILPDVDRLRVLTDTATAPVANAALADELRDTVSLAFLGLLAPPCPGRGRRGGEGDAGGIARRDRKGVATIGALGLPHHGAFASNR